MNAPTKQPEVPYLLRGIKPIETTSSTLVSSSPYLNSPKMREWLTYAFLRRSGKDRPTSADGYDLHIVLKEIFDIDRIEELFTAERKKSPALDKWFTEGFSSNFSKEELLSHPEGSLDQDHHASEGEDRTVDVHGRAPH